MEDMEEVRYDVANTIRLYVDGLTSEEIWKKQKDFEDRTQLSKALRILVQLGVIYKKDDKYHHVDNTATLERKQAQVEEEKPVKTERVITVPKGTLIKPKEKEVEKTSVTIPMGINRRTGITGATVYAFYAFRDESPLTIEDLVKLTGKDKGSVYSGVIRLIEGNYVEVVNSSVRPYTYKWSGKYKYPFKDCRPDDKQFIRYTPLEFYNPNYKTGVTIEKTVIEQRKTQEQLLVNTSNTESKDTMVNKNVAPVSNGKECVASTKMLEVLLTIDQQITILQNQIQKLEKLKKTLSEPLTDCLVTS